MARKGTRKTVAKTPDIRTVAALAKVSIATVSRTSTVHPLSATGFPSGFGRRSSN